MPSFHDDYIILLPWLGDTGPEEASSLLQDMHIDDFVGYMPNFSPVDAEA